MSNFQTFRALGCAAVLAWVSVVGINSALASPYSDAVLADNPLAYYRLQETSGAVAANSGTAGAALDGSTATFSDPQTAPSTQPMIGQPGPRPTDLVGGLPLVGFEADNVGIRQTNNTGAQVAVPDNDLLDLTGALTLEVWVQKNAIQVSSGNNEGILGKFIGTGNNRSYVLAATSTGDLQFIINSTGAAAGNVVYSPGYTIPAGGDWVHLAAVFVPSTSMTVYVNGAVVGTPLAAGVPASVFVGTADLWIGRQFGTATNVSFEGLIDEAAVYDSALTGEQIAAHYAAAVPEPATWLSALLAIAGTMIARRKWSR